MTLTFNSTVYRDLLTEVNPKVIETEREYEQTLAIVEKLSFNKNRTPEETALYKLLVMLVEAYEEEHYPISVPSPNEILCHIMESSGIGEEDLVGIIGSSTVVAEMVHGERAIGKAQAKILGNLFKVSPSLFI